MCNSHKLLLLLFQPLDSGGNEWKRIAYNVTLGTSSDFENVVWRFPNSIVCPHRDCELTFSSRYIALNHFRKNHADTSMLCYVCREIISVQAPFNLLLHFHLEHPHDSPPKLKSATKMNTIKYAIKCKNLMLKIHNDLASMENERCISLTEKELQSSKPEINARLSAMAYQKCTQTQVS